LKPQVRQSISIKAIAPAVSGRPAGVAINGSDDIVPRDRLGAVLLLSG
jgi:hypothetical protein